MLTSTAAELTSFTPYTGLTNSQVYATMFAELFLRPDPETGRLRGNNQREQFIPPLQQILAGLPASPRIVDVGGGAGEIIELADFPTHLSGTPVVSVIEPNGEMIARYRSRVAASSKLVEGTFYAGAVQDLYRAPGNDTSGFSDTHLCLSLHMVYHLTRFDQPFRRPPADDLIDAVAFMLERLQPGGKLFLVYADLADASLGAATLHSFRHMGDTATADRISIIYNTRNALLRDRGIAGILSSRIPDAEFTMESTVQQTSLFGRNLFELAAMCGAGEQIPANNEPFDVQVFQRNYDFLSRHGDDPRVQLVRETTDPFRKGYWRMRQPQVLITFTRTA